MRLAEISPGRTTVGWIGTGVMGRSMAAHLLAAGYSLVLYNRTRMKADSLLERGARWADSPQAVAQQSDVVFTMVGFPTDVREVILGPRGVLQGCRPGSLIVDMTTSEPSLAAEIAETARPLQVYALDAPVSGGDVGARQATLSIMVGGEPEVFQAALPLFQKMGQHIVHLGPAGSGQHAKMCNQILIASTMIGVCEALLYGYKAGLDLGKVIEAVGKGAAASWSVNNLGPRILQRNFDPGFFVEHFIKDMGIALQEAKRMDLCLPGLALAHQLYVAVKAQGHGRLGTHALMLALEQLNDTQVLVRQG